MLMAAGTIAVLVSSRSNPWLVGVQNEPHWAWAVGSGRLKLWLAEPGAFSREDPWTSSWYRGLDGQPLRWDFTLHRGSTGGIIVLALPLWTFACAGSIGGICLLFLGRQERQIEESAGS